MCCRNGATQSISLVCLSGEESIGICMAEAERALDRAGRLDMGSMVADSRLDLSLQLGCLSRAVPVPRGSIIFLSAQQLYAHFNSFTPKQASPKPV